VLPEAPRKLKPALPGWGPNRGSRVGMESCHRRWQAGGVGYARPSGRWRSGFGSGKSDECVSAPKTSLDTVYTKNSTG